jgi:tetratricopeptide (TPR) repeat protein
MIARKRIATCAFSALVMVQFLCCTKLQAGRHAFEIGDKMPEFSATTLSGQVFTFKHNKGKALMVVFVSAKQKRSTRAAADVEKIVLQLETNAERLETVIAVDDPNGLDFQSKQQAPAKNIHILLDSEYKLWGKFGIIATPTVVIADTNDKVICVKAGYGYDFVPVVRAYVNQALGLAQKTAPEDAGRVKTVSNDTTAARLKRHLQMAKMLEQKGRIESAIAEIQKAMELDPDTPEAALELGELFCRAGRSKAALEITESLSVTSRLDKARLLLISGWAKRQMGELDTAEKILIEATKLDPKSARALFELGKIYQARQQNDKAMESYYKALTLILG